jgi:hypothetical protein
MDRREHAKQQVAGKYWNNIWSLFCWAFVFLQELRVAHTHVDVAGPTQQQCPGGA